MKKLLVLATLTLIPFTLAACGSEKVDEIIDSGEDVIASGAAMGEELIDETINEVEGLVDEVENEINDLMTDEETEGTGSIDEETGSIDEENTDIVTPEIIVE